MRDATTASLDELWSQYQPAILGRVHVIALAVLSLRLGTLDAASRANARRASHKVAGFANTFGFWHASELAREAEAAFESLDPIPGTTVTRLDEIATSLSRELSGETGHPSNEIRA